MAFTRFNDDICGIEKQLQQSTDPGRYILNVPGNGINMSFVEDPYIRLEKWGANRMTNITNVESDLRGLSRSTNRDYINKNNYKKNATSSNAIKYPVNKDDITLQPRATNPAWTARDLEQANWQILHFDPQENIFLPFNNNISTRIIEKENFVAFPNN